MTKPEQLSDADNDAIWYELQHVDFDDMTSHFRIKRDAKTKRKVSAALRKRIEQLTELLRRWEAK